MLAGKLQPESPTRGAGYTSPLRASQQSIGIYKAAGMGQGASPHGAEHGPRHQHGRSPRPGSPQPLRSPANFPAGPTNRLEHVAERFSSFYSDLEQEKQVGGAQSAGQRGVGSSTQQSSSVPAQPHCHAAVA